MRKAPCRSQPLHTHLQAYDWLCLWSFLTAVLPQTLILHPSQHIWGLLMEHSGPPRWGVEESSVQGGATTPPLGLLDATPLECVSTAITGAIW